MQKCIGDKVVDMYDLWLAGMSLSRVGQVFGFSKVGVYQAIQRRYGEGATSTRVASMARSVIADYGYVPDSLKRTLLSVEGTYYSNRTMQGQSRNYGEYLDNYPYAQEEPEDYAEPLRWYYVYSFLSYVKNLVGYCLAMAWEAWEAGSSDLTPHL